MLCISFFRKNSILLPANCTNLDRFQITDLTQIWLTSDKMNSVVMIDISNFANPHCYWLPNLLKSSYFQHSEKNFQRSPNSKFQVFFALQKGHKSGLFALSIRFGVRRSVCIIIVDDGLSITTFLLLALIDIRPTAVSQFFCWTPKTT